MINEFYSWKIENREKDLWWYLYNELNIDIDSAYAIEYLAKQIHKKIPYVG